MTLCDLAFAKYGPGVDRVSPSISFVVFWILFPPYKQSVTAGKDLLHLCFLSPKIFHSDIVAMNTDYHHTQQCGLFSLCLPMEMDAYAVSCGCWAKDKILNPLFSASVYFQFAFA